MGRTAGAARGVRSFASSRAGRRSRPRAEQRDRTAPPFSKGERRLRPQPRQRRRRTGCGSAHSAPFRGRPRRNRNVAPPSRHGVPRDRFARATGQDQVGGERNALRPSRAVMHLFMLPSSPSARRERRCRGES
jgi:hypothetical protein